jgi:hypothetical protein
MFSFFSRRSSKLPINSVPYYCDTSLSKYLIDTTNKIKEDYKDNKCILNSNAITSYKNNCNCHLISVISTFSFLVGYYLSKFTIFT